MLSPRLDLPEKKKKEQIRRQTSTIIRQQEQVLLKGSDPFRINMTFSIARCRIAWHVACMKETKRKERNATQRSAGRGVRC